MSDYNEMLKEDKEWFFRVDCWWFGFRITGSDNEI